jgi:hypothetical protein
MRHQASLYVQHARCCRAMYTCPALEFHLVTLEAALANRQSSMHTIATSLTLLA